MERTREEFLIGGLEFGLKDGENLPKPRKLDEKQEAFLIATACSNPLGGRVLWTMRSLAEHLVKVGVIDRISDETIHQTLKKMKLNYG
ncbi:helix-turn-helix domain-containing protein [Trichormus azollae]|uniref:helix-turn-helix domain-containing protein n=1 Tax=Trichormus azollae TaxID=1164 RepID=UPI0002D727AE|nr:helix-turn-helix domain-containing protein [Trichormus azollae]